jgi:hypothetical protein
MPWRPLAEAPPELDVRAMLGGKPQRFDELLDRAIACAYLDIEDDSLAQAIEYFAKDVEAGSNEPATSDRFAQPSMLRVRDEAADRKHDHAGHAARTPSDRDFTSHGRTTALFGGAAHLGWAVAHLATGDAANATIRAISRWLRDALPKAGYDLISGAVGIGAFALESDDHELALRVLETLDTRGEAHWHTPPDELAEPERVLAPSGYRNLGLAHGVPGVIALLARFVARDIDRSRSTRLLDRAVALVLETASPYPMWVPSPEPAGGALAWCYGDLGVAISLVSAGVFAGHREAYDVGLKLARGAAGWSRAYDASLCHGAAGVLHLFNRLAQTTGDPVLHDAAMRWLAIALARRDEVQDATLLTGTVGVALALQAATTDVEPTWDRRLLIDVS